jgi:hypothetical protein
MGNRERGYCVFVNHYDDGSPQNKTPPIADGLSRDTARFLAEALNEGGYLRESLVALVGKSIEQS